MPEASVPGMSTNSIMERAEAALSDVGEVEVDLTSEAGQEPEEDLFGLDEPTKGEPEEQADDDDGESAAAAKPDNKPGSRAAPYTVKTLPDAFVTLKIDGEEQVVPLREMTDGYMRQEAFHKRMNQVAQLTERAKEAGERFKTESERFRSSFTSLINSPDELFSFLDDHSPEVLDAVSRKQLQRIMAWQNDPQARIAHEYDKRQRALEKQRERLEAERGEYQRTRQEQEAHQRYLAEFKPGYEAGMKRAGYPKVTDELRETVKGLIAAKRASAGKVTAKDVEEAVVRAARAVGAETVAARKPAPAPVAAPGRKPAQSAARKSSGAKSFNQLFRDLGK